MENKKTPVSMNVRVVKSREDTYHLNIFNDEKEIEKSDKSEQLTGEKAMSASNWITHRINMQGLKTMVDHSTILPQCIRAYKNNIAGFGLSVSYNTDYDEETADMKAEWDKLEEIISFLNFDMMPKEIFEKIVVDRETYGIAYAEVIRNLSGEICELDFLVDTPTIDMTIPLEPYIDTKFYAKGKEMMRKKKFKKYRQTVNGETVYYKEIGDPRIMNKKNGEYEDADFDDRANELIEFKIGNAPYGEIRWIGQALTIDGNRMAENLNNNYFRKGRHTPLMILIKGGRLTDEAFSKLQEYMDDIEGEKGQHSFLLLEAENSDTTAAFATSEQPTVEIKDLASILQKDELFQDYLENGRKKVQSAFLLPDLYTGYTTDFNRATAQTAMEVTEKQVFQPERASLAWILNHKIFAEYNFKYVEAKFDEPDITNPDDIQKMLSILERAGGISPNMAKEKAFEVLGKEGCEDYPEEWGNVPLALTRNAISSGLPDVQYENGKGGKNAPTGQNTEPKEQKISVSDDELKAFDKQIKKAEENDGDIVSIMKEIRKALAEYRSAGA